MTRTDWLTRHPYLQPLADVQRAVDAALGATDVPAAGVPNWDDYAAEFQRGVPLLQSDTSPLDQHATATACAVLLRKLAAAPLPGHLDDECRHLATELERHDDVLSLSAPGLLHLAGWAIAGRQLATVLPMFDRWRDEEHWRRNYCPTCGAPPAMAQLVGVDPGRIRWLSCGCCRTRWQYPRTGCPFCEPQDDHRLMVLALDGENGLRIDYCERCGGYLKTYNGSGDEAVLLADWTSIHLDFIARERGLKRLAASLYVLNS